MMFRNSLWAGFALAVVQGAVWGQGADPAKGPGPAVEYKQDLPEELSAKEFNDLKGTVYKILRGDTPLSGDTQPIFDKFFLKVYFRYMTQNDPESLRKLPDTRIRFFRDMMEVTGMPAPVHVYLANLTLTEMTRQAGENYHPAVRYNAMLIIGLLNDQETVRVGANRMNPEPYARALQPMADAYADPKQLDLVRLAALWGMVRHLEGDNYRQPNQRMAPEVRTEVLTHLNNLANQNAGPAYRTAEGHLWMRRKAVEGLGFATQETAIPGVVKTLDSLLADDKEASPVRVQCALALGRVHWANGWPGGPKYDVVAGLTNLQKLAADLFADEVALFEGEKKREAELVGVVGAAGGAGGGAFSGSAAPIRPAGQFDPNGLGIAADPLAYRVEGSRRRVRHGLYAIEQALKGVDDRAKPVAGEPRGLTYLATADKSKKAEKQRHDELKEGLDGWIKLIETDTQGMDRETYVKELRAAIARVGGRAPAAAPPAAAPADPNELPGGLPAAAAPKAPADPLDTLPGS